MSIKTNAIANKKDEKITNFSNFLATEKMADGRSYAQYLKCFNTDQAMVDAAKETNPGIIDTSQDYGIMFIYAKKGYLQKMWSTWNYAKKGMATGATEAAILIFAPDFTVTKATAFVIIAANTAAGATYGYTTGTEKAADWQACVMLFPYNQQTLDSLKCTYMSGQQGARE